MWEGESARYLFTKIFCGYINDFVFHPFDETIFISISDSKISKWNSTFSNTLMLVRIEGTDLVKIKEIPTNACGKIKGCSVDADFLTCHPKGHLFACGGVKIIKIYSYDGKNAELIEEIGIIEPIPSGTFIKNEQPLFLNDIRQLAFRPHGHNVIARTNNEITCLAGVDTVSTSQVKSAHQKKNNNAKNYFFF